MQCRELIEKLEKLAPVPYACDWDNPGLLVGRMDQEIKRVLVALDATDSVIDQAAEQQADLIVTHHPMIFKPLKKINDQDFISRRVLRLAAGGIGCYAMHTNFDIAPGCMADLAAERLGLQEGVPLEVTGEADGKLIGIGKIGILPEKLTLGELAGQVKERFELPFVTVYGMDAVTEPVSRIAVSPGAGGSMIGAAVASGVQVLVTGDIGHHDGIDAAANRLAVIDAGHYGLEHIFIPFMKKYIQQASAGRLEVLEAKPAFPQQVI